MFPTLKLFPRQSPQGWELLPSASASLEAWFGAYSCDGKWCRAPIGSLSIVATPPSRHPDIALRFVEHSLNESQWHECCAEVTEAFSRGAKKIVLARSTQWELSRQCDPMELLQAISSPTTTGILWTPDSNDPGTWCGASPELLFRREGQNLYLEAVAGTAPVHEDPILDEKEQVDLLNCLRRRQECDLVAEEFLERLAGLGIRANSMPASVVKRGHCFHLFRAIHATVNTTSDQALVETLHPSPAVDALPRSFQSLRRQLEPQRRLWYASAVGVSQKEMAQFWVLLRCAHLMESSLCSYAGVGLVPGFQSVDEWAELNWKETPWRNLASAATP